jgi:hypothetical protein
MTCPTHLNEAPTAAAAAPVVGFIMIVS